MNAAPQHPPGSIFMVVAPSALVIVAFNEATRIRRKLESCLLQSYPRPLTRIVVASDGSLDATAAVVREFARENVTLLEFPARRGKASCLNDAIATCDEEVLVLTDARQRLDPRAVESLVSNFSDPDVGAASGELRLEAEGEAGFGESVDAYWRYEKFLRRSESAFHSTVGATGALYALRRSSFRPIPPDTILDDVLIPLNVVFDGRRVVFDHQALAFDERMVDISRERARKVRTLAGNFQLPPIWASQVPEHVCRRPRPFEILNPSMRPLAPVPKYTAEHGVVAPTVQLLVTHAFPVGSMTVTDGPSVDTRSTFGNTRTASLYVPGLTRTRTPPGSLRCPQMASWILQ